MGWWEGRWTVAEVARRGLRRRWHLGRVLNEGRAKRLTAREKHWGKTNNKQEGCEVVIRRTRREAGLAAAEPVGGG